MIPVRIALAAFTLAFAAPAFAGNVIPLAPFNSLELHGGGNVILKHGDVQRVTIIAGSTKYSTLTVTNGKLDINACDDWWHCPAHYDLRVEIVTPQIAALSVHGGGELRSDGSFPEQKSLTISVHGGGDVDLRSMPAQSVNAEVHGGGDLKTTASHSLNASVHGGGDLTYWGNPAQLSVSTHGGGEVERGGD